MNMANREFVAGPSESRRHRGHGNAAALRPPVLQGQYLIGAFGKLGGKLVHFDVDGFRIPRARIAARVRQERTRFPVWRAGGKPARTGWQTTAKRRQVLVSLHLNDLVFDGVGRASVTQHVRIAWTFRDIGRTNPSKSGHLRRWADAMGEIARGF